MMKLLAYLFAVIILSGSALAINQAVLPEVRMINLQDTANLYIDNLPLHLGVEYGEITPYQKVSAAKTIQVETASLTQSLAIPVRNNQAYTVMNLPDRIWVLNDEYKNVRFGYTKIRVINLGNQTVSLDYDGLSIFSDVGYAQEPNNVMVNAGRHDLVVSTTDGVLATFDNFALVDRAIYTLFIIDGTVILKKDYQLWQK
jgi:hypothetical protein